MLLIDTSVWLNFGKGLKMTDQPLIQVEASPTFNRNLRALAKKYNSIRNDIKSGSI